MERADRAALIRLPGAILRERLEPGKTVMVDEDTAHHMRVRRVTAGSAIRVTDGAGRLGRATLVTLDRRRASVEVETVFQEPPPPPVRLLVPVADRDRMLWLAEKATELSLSRWTPVYWQRSRNVSPRGEGDSFRARVRARMASALVQCGGAWLPAVDEERDASPLLESLDVGESVRLFLDPSGVPMLAALDRRDPDASGLEGASNGVVVALGPEGGLLDDEIQLLGAHGFRGCSLGSRVLRFETAAIAALSTLLASGELDAALARGSAG